MRRSKNSFGCHLCGQWNLSPESDAHQGLESEGSGPWTVLGRVHACDSSQRAWNAVRVLSGAAQSCSPISPTRKLRQEAGDLPGPQAQQWQRRATSPPPQPPAHHLCGKGVCPRLEPRTSAAPGLAQPGLWERRRVLPLSLVLPPLRGAQQMLRSMKLLAVPLKA